MNRLDEMKLCNDSRKVEKRAKGGMKIKDVVNKVGVCNSDVIIVHAGTCDIKAKTPEEFSDEIITALQAIKEPGTIAPKLHFQAFCDEKIVSC